jgi:histidinol dehydrogenase
VKDLNEAIELMNEYAPEHLIISCNDAESIAEQIKMPVLFCNYSPESAGDYASGTNHYLLMVLQSFTAAFLRIVFKKITFQQLTEEGLKISAQQ